MTGVQMELLTTEYKNNESSILSETEQKNVFPGYCQFKFFFYTKCNFKKKQAKWSKSYNRDSIMLSEIVKN